MFPLSATTDCQQLGLEPNGEGYAIVLAAFVHTSYASGGVSLTQGATQSIEASVAGNGYTNTQFYGSTTTANPVSNGVSEIDLHYQTTGVMNETNGAVVSTTHSYGAPFNPSEKSVTPTDPYTAPPAGANVTTVGSTGGSWARKGDGPIYAGVSHNLLPRGNSHR